MVVMANTINVSVYCESVTAGMQRKHRTHLVLENVCEQANLVESLIEPLNWLDRMQGGEDAVP